MRAFRNLSTALLFVALLTPSAAMAASSTARNHKPAKAEHARLSLGIRAWVQALGIWTKEGLGIDPDGRNAPSPSSGSQTSAGLGIDPDGRDGS
jgi:hypothetical protein